MSSEKTAESSFFKKVFSTKSINAFVVFYKNNFLVLACSKLISIGLILKVWITRSSLGNIDEKQALVLLQAKDFSKGQLSIMREGRFTGGSLEILLNAPFVAIFGPTKTVTWIVPLLIMAASSYVLWRSFVNTPHKETMRLVMAGLWISPAYLVISSSRATGHIALEIFLYVCIFASAYYAAHSLRNLRYFYLWAFLAGVAIWINPFSIFFSIVCLVWIFVSAPAMRKQKLRTFAFFTLGSSALWLHVLDVIFSDKNLVLVSASTDQQYEYPKNALVTLGQFLGQSTYSSNSYSDTKINVFPLSLSVLFMGVLAFSFYKNRFTHLSDFRKLHSLTFLFFCLIPITYFILDQELLPETLTPLIIPAIFLVFSASKSRFYISITFLLLISISISSTQNSINETSNSSKIASSKIADVLEKQDISTAIGSHEISYPITVNTNDKIVVSPFNGNDFNSRRNKKVQASVEALIIDTNHKSETDLAFCIQGTFGTSFKTIQTDSFDILVVDENLRTKIWQVVKRCNAR